MTVRITDSVIHLEGNCRVEEAEALLLALQERPEDAVDMTNATRIHLALAQILLARRPKIHGIPSDPFLRDHLLPLLHSPIELFRPEITR